jgi:DNA-directed RNA polymerase subunit H (RpoH/RPB5)
MNYSETQIKVLFSIRKTCIEMLSDRGYEIPEIQQNVSYEDFRIMFNNKNIDLVINKGEKNENDVYIFYQFNDASFGKNDLKKLVDNVFKEMGTNEVLIIIVLKDKPGSSIKKEIKLPKYENTELFTRNHLKFNVSKHYLVPEHTPISNEEALKVLEKYNCTREQVPGILIEDPQVKYHGMKVGDMCRIVRTNKFNGYDIYYRIVRNQ